MSEQISGGVKHPNDMTKEELRDLVFAMSSMALDLAQHLDWTTNCLRVQYKKDAYRRAIKMAREICYAWEYLHEKGNCEVAIFGSDGLTVERGSLTEILESPVDRPDNDKEINLNDFEQVFDDIDMVLENGEYINRAQKSLQYLQDISEGKVGKDHVDVRVKSLRKGIYSLESIQSVMKSAKAIVDIMRATL